MKKGKIAVGEKVVVAWGKSKKTYNADVISIGGILSSQETPRQDASSEEQFTFELASPAPEPQPVDLPCPYQPTLQAATRQEDKLDNLTDAVSQLEARLLQRVQMLEDSILEEIRERCVLHPPLKQSLAPVQSCLPALVRETSIPQQSSEQPLPTAVHPWLPPVPQSLEASTPEPLTVWHGPENTDTNQMTPFPNPGPLQYINNQAATIHSPPVSISPVFLTLLCRVVVRKETWLLNWQQSCTR